jgi:uncharacterized protein YggT (Ycf19 family)
MAQSSVAAEVGWLAFFLAVFVAAAYALLRWLVPHHFNDKIAVTLAAILAGLVMIFVRGGAARRARRR